MSLFQYRDICTEITIRLFFFDTHTYILVYDIWYRAHIPYKIHIKASERSINSTHKGGDNHRGLLLLLLSHFSRVRLCVTPSTAAHQAPPSLGFSGQEHQSGLPFPSPMHESEKWKGSRSVVADSSRPHGLQPTRLLRPWDFPGKSIGVGCHCLLQRTAK